MKKITLLFGALVVALIANAQSVLNNPNGSDGKMTFIWDCEKEDFATELPSNAIEVDQTFTFAVDITGTPLETWVQGTTTGAERSIGFVFTAEGGNQTGIPGRLAKIKTNIYGMDLNLTQLAASELVNFFGDDPTVVTTPGAITYIYGSVFGFAYNVENPAAEWWQEPQLTVVHFETTPYTGTKTSVAFWNDEYPETGFFQDFTWGGYAYPCAADKSSATQIESFVSDSPVIGYNYYSVLGTQLSEAPASGVYIVKEIKADGTSKTYKAIK